MNEILVEKVIEILKEFKLVNPVLVSDGHGQYPDVYKISESDLDEIEDELLEHSY